MGETQPTPAPTPTPTATSFEDVAAEVENTTLASPTPTAVPNGSSPQIEDDPYGFSFDPEDPGVQTRNFLSSWGTSGSRIAQLYKLLTLSGFLPFATYRGLKRIGGLENVRPELLGALDNANQTMSYTNHSDLTSFLQSAAHGVELSDLAPASQRPSDQALRQTARGVLGGLTGVSPRGQVRELADSFSMSEARHGDDAQTQFVEEVESEHGGAVLAARADRAMSVLDQLLGGN